MKFKKFRKQLEKDISKSCGISRRELQKDTHFSILYDLAKECELERIKVLRAWFEEWFRDKYPEYKDMTFKWEEF